MLNLTEVRVSLRPNDHEKLRAFASITLDNAFVVRGIKIIRRGSGDLFVAMPSRQTRSGEDQDVCHPINQQARDQIEQFVLAKYEEEVAARTSIRPDQEKTSNGENRTSSNISMISTRSD